MATGSRDEQRAADFAAEFGGRAHGSYEALVADPEVDVVYVATPHVLHDANTRLALEAGKAVLCEKPMTLDAATTTALFAEASDRGLFLMEAMWMACHPTIRTLLRLLASGDHGTPRQIHASIGFVVPGATDGGEQTGRLLDPALGGGALLDMGIYPLTFAHLVLGEPEQLTAVANLSAKGIDLDVSVAGLYPEGATAALTATLSAHPSVTATVATELGQFDLPRPFYSPERLRWTSYDETGGTRRVDRTRRAGGRPGLRQRDPRGPPLPAGRRPDQHTRPARADDLGDGADGLRPRGNRRRHTAGRVQP